MPILEVCTGSLQSVINAVTGGAKRIELCSALSLDGLTPSLGLIKIVRKMFPELTIHTLIRPREGDFFYNEEEIEEMLLLIRESFLPAFESLKELFLRKQEEIEKDEQGL